MNKRNILRSKSQSRKTCTHHKS